MSNLPHNPLHNDPLVAGSFFSVTVPLVDGDNNPVVDAYNGTETLSGEAIPGPGMPAEWTIEAEWADPETYPPASTPAVVLSWAAGVTTGIEEGTYHALVTIDGVPAYLGTFTIVPGANADAVLSPTPLISVAEFKARVGTWPESLQTGATGAGLRKILSLATADLHNHIADRYAIAYRGATYHAERRAEFFAALATPSNLATTDAMKDYIAFRALWRLVAFQPSAKDDKGETAAIRDLAAREASAALGRIVAVVEGYAAPIVFGSGAVRVVRG